MNHQTNTNMDIRFHYTTESRTILGDLYTPVGVYMRLRDLYPQSALMESSDYHDANNSRSFIGVNPMASVAVSHGESICTFPDGSVVRRQLDKDYRTHHVINDFLDRFQDYILYRDVIVFDHHNSKITLVTLCQEQSATGQVLDDLLRAMNRGNINAYDFHPVGDTSSSLTDEEHKENIRKGIRHCLRGDVFQIVLSRRFVQKYEGDDFKLYRALRSINPSPYLFYFDFGGFRIFGSSPETHCRIEKVTEGSQTAYHAFIDPIAGTTRRTGDEEQDRQNAEYLRNDPKENAEHVMLVDLARNDLSRNCHGVKVEFYKDLQYYSHVIHLVSRVSGVLDDQADPIKTFIDTFPAGTLSGAPKVRAMQLISEYEPHNRGAYGGCIGYIGFDRSLNHAITIRTFVSRNGELWFQAGGGIVAKSNEEYELQEVNNKLGALRRAILLAESM